MKVLFYTLCILCISIPSFGQKKVTVYKPTANKEYVKMSQLENKVVSLCFKDSRVIPPKSKIKCTFKDIVDAITESLDLSYGNSFVKCMEDSDIDIFIDVKSYDVSFYTGMWHAQTKYIVKLTSDTDSFDKEIEQINRQFNTLPGVDKKVLNKCFTNANLQLFEFINDVIN